MSPPRAWPFALALVGCSSSDLVVTVVDEHGGWPVVGYRWTATSDRAVGCPELEATTDDQGRMRLSGACPYATYTLSDPLGLRRIDAQPRGQEPVQVSAGVAPDGGVWRLHARGLDPIAATSEARTERRGDQTVTYPQTLPANLIQLEPEDFVVLAGSARHELPTPLIPGDGWWFAGGEAGPDGAFTPQAPLEPGLATTTDDVRLIAASRLPPGRWLVSVPPRLALFDAPGAPPAAAPEPPAVDVPVVDGVGLEPEPDGLPPIAPLDR